MVNFAMLSYHMTMTIINSDDNKESRQPILNYDTWNSLHLTLFESFIIIYLQCNVDIWFVWYNAMQDTFINHSKWSLTKFVQDCNIVSGYLPVITDVRCQTTTQDIHLSLVQCFWPLNKKTKDSNWTEELRKTSTVTRRENETLWTLEVTQSVIK